MSLPSCFASPLWYRRLRLLYPGRVSSGLFGMLRSVVGAGGFVPSPIASMWGEDDAPARDRCVGALYEEASARVLF